MKHELAVAMMRTLYRIDFAMPIGLYVARHTMTWLIAAVPLIVWHWIRLDRTRMTVVSMQRPIEEHRVS